MTEAKQCYRCKKIKPLNEYHKDSAKKDGKASTCKRCYAVANREAYLRTYKSKAPKENIDCGWCGRSFLPPQRTSRFCSPKCWSKGNTKENPKVQFILAEKSKPCTDCGNTYHTACMQFDHLPGFEKKFEVNLRAARARQMPDILAEIAKCELVCANCHAYRTWARKQ